MKGVKYQLSVVFLICPYKFWVTVVVKYEYPAADSSDCEHTIVVARAIIAKITFSTESFVLSVDHFPENIDDINAIVRFVAT